MSSSSSTSSDILASATSTAAAASPTPGTTLSTSTMASGMSTTLTGVATSSGFLNGTAHNSTAHATMVVPPGPDWQTVVAVVSAILLVVMILTGVIYCKINRVSRSEAEALELREAHSSIGSSDTDLPVYSIQHVEHAPADDHYAANKETGLGIPAARTEGTRDEEVESQAKPEVENLEALADTTPPPPPPSPKAGVAADHHKVKLPTEDDFYYLDVFPLPCDIPFNL